MTQDNYLGRIATAVSILKKDSSLIPRALAIFKTLISRHRFDPVPEHDILPLLNLYFSYALKCGMSFHSLVKVFLAAGPQQHGKDIVFTTFDKHHIGAQLKLLMQGQVPETHTDSPLYSEIVSCLSNMYVSKLRNMQKS
jgi:hypothetical protein